LEEDEDDNDVDDAASWETVASSDEALEAGVFAPLPNTCLKCKMCYRSLSWM